MIPILYEFIRALKSKTVIILTVVIILFSMGIALGISTGVTTTTPQNQISSTAYGYGNNGSYNITVELVNHYGAPVVGSTINVTLYKGDVLRGTTNSHGIANFSVTNVNSTDLTTLGENYYLITYNYSTALGNVVNLECLLYSGNQTNPYFFQQENKISTGGGFKTLTNNVTRYYFRDIGIENQQIRNGILLQYLGGYNGSIPAVSLYYKVYDTTNGYNINTSSLTESNMTYYGTYHAYSKKFSLLNLSGDSNHVYVFALFTPSGQAITYGQVYVQTTASSSQISSIFFAGEMALLGLFVPLMAAVSAYMTYGKDKTGSVLESILVRPVSRRGLILSRYVANTLAVFIAALGSFLVTSFVFEYYLGSMLPVQTFEYGLWALFVGIAGFIGLVYLAASFLKSQGALLGFAISIFFVLDLFWMFLPLIPNLIIAYVLKLSSGGLAYGKAIVAFYYATPVGFGDIARLIIGGQASNLVFNVQGVTLADIGITPAIMFGLGIIWIAVPIVLATYFFSKRD